MKLGTTAPSETFTVYIIKTFLRITSTCSVKMKMFSETVNIELYSMHFAITNKIININVRHVVAET